MSSENLIGPYRNDFTHCYRPCVETGIYAHDVNAGLRVASHDRPLDWSGASPTRQQ
jgi:hypothetical protein